MGDTRYINGKSSYMEYRVLGRTGLRVSKLCLGAMMFGGSYASRSDAEKIMNSAFDAGINLVDTADGYSGGESEEIVGRVVRGRHEEILIATKVWAPMGSDPNQRGLSRRWIISECEASLRRLGVDHIDLYQVHRPDPDTDLEETLGALTDLVHAGKIRYVGSSTFPASEIVEAQWAAQRRNTQRFVSEQPPYSLLVRGAESDVLPTCQRHGLGVITWSPLAGGWLTGKWRQGTSTTDGLRSERTPDRYSLSVPANQLKLQLVEQLAGLASAAGISLVQMSIAWVANNPAVTAPIIGPRTLEQLEGQLDALDVILDDDLLDRIDEIVPPGTTINQADGGYQPPHVTDASTRRRLAGRTAR